MKDKNLPDDNNSKSLEELTQEANSIVEELEKYDNLIIEGDVNYAGTTAGYQTIWIAGVAQGAFDFGTACAIGTADHAADDLTIVVEGTDADDVFAIGDTIIAFDADGSGETTIGNVTAVAADLITVDAAPNLIADEDEVCNLNPIVIKLGLEY